MTNQPNQKLKLLYILRTLLEKTDDVQGVTTQDLIEELAYHGIYAERKSINRDLWALRDFGLDIQQRSHKYWYLANRPLELQEMIMLVDAVQSAPFLTDALTDELIERIQRLASVDQRKMLQRRIEVPGRVKMQNESVLQNLDIIQQAMRLKRKVVFQYFQYDASKKRVLRKGGDTYTATPVRLVYADEFYYLITFNDYWAEHGGSAFTPYRVDRMMNVQVGEDPATRDPRIANYLLEEHISPSFGVYAADVVPMVLEVDTSAMNPIIDKFGLDAVVFEKEGDRAQVHVKAPLSPQFFGWLMQMGPLVKIVHPKSAADAYREQLRQIQKMYRGNYRILSERGRVALSQELFLGLCNHLLDELKARKRRGEPAFTSEAAFNVYAWSVIEGWLLEQGADDGMPRGEPLYREIRGKERAVPRPMDLRAYAAFGQAAGEAIIAAEPRKWAAPEAREAFADVKARYGAPDAAFAFAAPPRLQDWEHGDDRSLRWSPAPGATFEIRRSREGGGKSAARRSRCFFIAEGEEPVELEPWQGESGTMGAYRAAMKHWQMIAYRFA